MNSRYALRSLIALLGCFSFVVGFAQYCPDSVITGNATYYPASNSGLCSFPVPNAPLYAAAMNTAQYDTAATCGACYTVTSAKGSITVLVQDICPTCSVNNMDISAAAALLLDTAEVITPIQWQLTGCPVTGSVQFTFQGSNPFYAKVQVRNHRYPVRTFEYLNGSTYVSLPKVEDNFFLAQTGMGYGPFTFRITDIIGDTIVESNIPLIGVSDSVYTGTQQFPLCTPKPSAIGNVPAAPDMEVLNSSKGFVLVNNENTTATFSVYNLLGAVVCEGRLDGMERKTVSIATAGLYLVQCYTPKGRMVSKVVVR